MTLEEMLQQYLAAQLAKTEPVKPAEEAQKAQQFVTPEMLTQALSGFATEVAKAVATEVAAVKLAVTEQVEKAMPVREPGAGRAGTENAVDPRETNPVAYLVAKARTSEGLSPEDKKLAWGITRAVIADGMRE
jgi:hypothetical protein